MIRRRTKGDLLGHISQRCVSTQVKEENVLIRMLVKSLIIGLRSSIIPTNIKRSSAPPTSMGQVSVSMVNIVHSLTQKPRSQLS